MIGPQGAGKSTQSRMLAARFDLVHISVGRIIRWHLEHRTKLASTIQTILDSGKLIPDEIVLDVVRRRIRQHDWNYGFVLDGFPRTLVQAEFLWQNWDIDRVIYIELPEDLVFERVFTRGKEGWGSGYTKRADADPQALRRRMRNYHRRTQPLLKLYSDLGMLVNIDGNMSISGVFSRITNTLGLHEGPV